MAMPSIIRPVLVDADSPFAGELCALCKEPFAPPSQIVICPQDGSRHHVSCWQANDNHCTAFGCTGEGLVQARGPIRSPRRVPNAVVITQPRVAPGRSKVRTMPSSSFGCARACFFLAVVLVFALLLAACFGLWTFVSSLLAAVTEWHLRSPGDGLTLLAGIDAGFRSLLCL
jgi:hypothetical protein